MARYFFHLHECGTVLLDEEGRDLASDQHAHTVAVLEAREMIASEVRAGRICLHSHIEVETKGGGFRVLFRDAVAMSGPKV